MLPAGEVLRRAADLVREVGLCGQEWWPGAYAGDRYEPGMPVCVVAAVAVVRGAEHEGDVVAVCYAEDPALTALYRWAGSHPTATAWSDLVARLGRPGRWLAVWALRLIARSCRG